jgi:endonuclease VIII
MPEGPSLVILREEVMPFKGKKILDARGYSKIDKSLLKNRKVTDFKTWGKHFLICLPQATVRIHFLLFGKYLINEKKKVNPVLHLKFSNGDVYFYTSAVTLLEDDLDNIYDWSADVMSDEWDAKKARKKLKEEPAVLACDAILNQNIFAGAGNIIKNEVLWRIKVHPETKIGKLPPRKLTELINEVRNYSFDFLKWKKAFVLKKNWKAHTKKACPRCESKLVKKYTGKTKRRSFFCKNCQEKY